MVLGKCHSETKLLKACALFKPDEHSESRLKEPVWRLRASLEPVWRLKEPLQDCIILFFIVGIEKLEGEESI